MGENGDPFRASGYDGQITLDGTAVALHREGFKARLSAGKSKRRRFAMARIAAAVLVSLVVAPGALAIGDNTRAGETVIARFKWSVTGSMEHMRSISNTSSCDAAGAGLVRAAFTGAGRGTLKVVRSSVPGITRYDYAFDPKVRLRSTVTKIDNTTQNPPEAAEDVCRPTDKSGCGTRALKGSFGYLQDVSFEGRLEFLVQGIGKAFGAPYCEDGGFIDFGRIDALRDLPKLYPGVPSPKKLARRRKRFTLTVHRRDSRNNGADVQSRALSVTFTPLR